MCVCVCLSLSCCSEDCENDIAMKVWPCSSSVNDLANVSDATKTNDVEQIISRPNDTIENKGACSNARCSGCTENYTDVMNPQALRPFVAQHDQPER